MPGVSGVREVVRARVGPDAWSAWFEGLDWARENEVVVVRCPDRFARDWIRKRYRTTWEALADEGVRLRVEGSEHTGDLPRVGRRGSAPSRPASSGVGTGRPRRGGLHAAARPAAPPDEGPHDDGEPAGDAFAGFVADSGNALALEASRAVAENRAGRCVPLLLVGGAGVGKTHLARAIQSASGSQALYRSAEEFTTEVTQAIRQGRMAEVRRRYRRAQNVLVLEDVQFLAGKRATQIELFHTLEHLTAHGARIVLTANSAPAGLRDLDADLRSRISSGLVAEIAPPEDRTRRIILRDKAAAGGVRVPEACIEILATRRVTSVRDLLSGLNQVIARATLLRRPVTPELVREALAAVELPGANRSVESIAARVAETHGLTRDALASRSRERRITRPRQLAMYLCRRYTDASLKEIGRAFGRDHSSVCYALEVVERRLLEQPKLRYQLEAIAARLGE